MKIAQVAVEKASFRFDKLFDYRIPEAFLDRVLPGAPVIVPFGRSDQPRQAMVFAVYETDAPDGRLKSLLLAPSETPLLNPELLALAAWLKEKTLCTYYDAVKSILPAGIHSRVAQFYSLGACAEDEEAASGLSGALAPQAVAYLRRAKKPVEEAKLLDALGLSDAAALEPLVASGVLSKNADAVRRIGDETAQMVRICAPPDGKPPKLTPKQQKVLQLLESAGTATPRELCYFAGVTKNVLKNLEAKGMVAFYEKEVYRTPYRADGASCTQPVALTGGQQRAYEGIRALLGGGGAAALLFGVTGSGKTAVFLRLIGDVVAAGKTAIVMVPEIALTPQAIERFMSCFGERVAVIHSGLSMGERLDEFKRIQNGKASIVIGTRSAVFAPLSNIGLIILDEEQESSYKSESAPRYHARDVAKFRCKTHGAVLLLASATPSVETYYAAERGVYKLFTLIERYGGAKLPQVTIVDMKDELESGNRGAYSRRLVRELAENLEHGEQSIVLINRRGFHTNVSCAECGEVAKCPHCSIALTYHRANDSLMCHYCGYLQDPFRKCPHCGSDYIKYAGLGTQRAEDELRALFPNARILRMDADTTMAKFAHDRAFQAFASGEYDILVGTQMVAKGLDFPNVTLVGVLGTDQSLYASDFRAYERTFSLLTQVIGRCGRGDKAGRAVLQTKTPENRVLQLAAEQDYPGFYSEELETRRILLYPPFCDVCVVSFAGAEEAQTLQAARVFYDALKEAALQRYTDLPLRVLGPVPNQVYRVMGKFRYKIIIKSRDVRRFRALLVETAGKAAAHPAARGVNIGVDIGGDTSI